VRGRTRYPDNPHGVLLAAFYPRHPPRGRRAHQARFIFACAIDIGLLVVCWLKGKPGMVLAGLFVPLVGLIGAIRLAKPTSYWAWHWYDQNKMAEAHGRFARLKVPLPIQVETRCRSAGGGGTGRAGWRRAWRRLKLDLGNTPGPCQTSSNGNGSRHERRRLTRDRGAGWRGGEGWGWGPQRARWMLLSLRARRTARALLHGKAVGVPGIHGALRSRFLQRP